MSQTIKISAVIITFNEERNIARCLESLHGVADEIIVVDSFSTDATEEICKEFDVVFIQNKFEGHIEQKNFAMKQARFDYVLSLDADEALSDELKHTILKIKEHPLNEAYKMNRLTSYCGKWIHHCGWYPDQKIRLWNKNKGHWGGENPHDKVIVDQEVTIAHLKGDILHYTFHTLSQHYIQMDKFTTIAAEQAINKNKRVYVIPHLTFYPFWIFVINYIIKLGFLDGVMGLVVCLNGAYYKFQKYAKIFTMKKYHAK